MNYNSELLKIGMVIRKESTMELFEIKDQIFGMLLFKGHKQASGKVIEQKINDGEYTIVHEGDEED